MLIVRKRCPNLDCLELLRNSMLDLQNLTIQVDHIRNFRGRCNTILVQGSCLEYRIFRWNQVVAEVENRGKNGEIWFKIWFKMEFFSYF